MIPVSSLFKTYADSVERVFDIKAEINGVTYDNKAVVEVDGEGNLMNGETLTLGEIAIQKLTVKVKTSPTTVIPSNSKIIVSLRLNGADGWSEWIQLTPCYIDSRDYNYGVWTFTCYDKLMWAQQKYVSALVYPAAQIDVLNEIASILGIALDSSVVINPAFMVPYKDEDATIHDVLSYIAASHGRSVKLTNDEKLAFVKLKGNAAPITVKTSQYFRVLQTNPVKSFTKIRVITDSEGNAIEVGTGDEDHTMEISNPYAATDSNILTNMYNEVNGITYVPFDMDWRGTVYTEIGDSLSINQMDTTATWSDTITWLEDYNPWQDENMPWSGILSFNTIVFNAKFTFINGLKASAISSSVSPQKSEFNFPGALSNQIKKAVRVDEEYYGVNISRQNGMKITHSSGRAEAIFNADKIAMRAGGVDKIYFDTLSDTYKISGTLEAVDGVFSGNLNAAGGTFSGELQAATGTFLGNLSANQIRTGTLSGVNIDVDNDVYIGDDLIFSNGALAIRHNTGTNFTFESGGSQLLRFYNNALYLNGHLIIPSGNTIGIFNTMGAYQSKIYLNSSGIDLLYGSGGTTEAAPVRINGWLQHNGARVGFFGTTAISRRSRNYPSSIVTTQTADSTYDTTEQNMLNNLKTDVNNLRSTLYNVIADLKAYGLVS